MENVEKLTVAMAQIIAEHEVMRDKLLELGQINDGIPIRWADSNEPIVDLEKTIAAFMKEKENEIH